MTHFKRLGLLLTVPICVVACATWPGATGQAPLQPEIATGFTRKPDDDLMSKQQFRQMHRGFRF